MCFVCHAGQHGSGVEGGAPCAHGLQKLGLSANPGILDEQDPTGFNPFFDIPSGPGTTAFLPVGTRINAEISFFLNGVDTDWFAVTLQQGQTYRFSATSLDVFGFGLADPRVFLFDNFANFLVSDDNGGIGFNAQLEVTATRTGTYFIGVDSALPGGIGQYEISLIQINPNADVVGQTQGTAETIALDQIVSGTIDTPEDQDWYKIRLEAGRVYAFEMDGDFLSPTPLGDPLIEISNSRGEIIAFNDDDGISYNSFVTAEIPETGDYFFRAQSNSATTGDFNLIVSDISPAAPPSPLSALDWGVALEDLEVTYYFARAGESFGTAGQLGVETNDRDWTDYEKAQAIAAMGEFAKVTNLTFREVSNPEAADFKLVKSFLDSSLSGKMAPPDNDLSPDQGVGWFNTNPVFWSDEAGGLLEPGAYGFSNFMHEFGHGMGLAHPHDNGDGEATIFDGVFSSADAGTFALNQEVFTVMSYNKGWQFGPEGGSGTQSFGIARSLMAFDIAILQQKYGANSNHRNGDSTYTLDVANGRGTGYTAIWDTGGRDTIVNPGALDSIIDLRPATLNLEVGGGGFVSWADGIFGGFTIANGVVIEDAIGGSGQDGLVGNAAANTLRGQRGADTLIGALGADSLFGGKGVDSLAGGNGADLLAGGDGNDSLSGGNGQDRLLGESGADTLDGGNGNDRIEGGDSADQLTGGLGRDTILGGNGADRLTGGKEADFLSGGLGADELNGGNGADTLRGGSGADTLNGGNGVDLADYATAEALVIDLASPGANTGQAAGDRYISIENVLGGGFGDRISGSAGPNQLSGGAGRDTLSGREGRDALLGENGADELRGGAGADTLFGGLGPDSLFGGSENDDLRGGKMGDRLDGGAGNDTLSGGGGLDRFVFSPGRDVITDFLALDSREKIDLSTAVGITGLADLRQSHLTQVGSDALITDAAGNTLRLLNVQRSDLDGGDFLF